MIDFANIDLLSDLDKLGPEFIPELIPVSIRDVDICPPMDMHYSVSDNCPRCGGNNMVVGDYVCWGFCFGCYKEATK